MSEAWAPLVTGTSFCTHPFEMVSTTGEAPRHFFSGLAVFNIGYGQPKSLTQLVNYRAPLLTVSEPEGFLADMRAADLPIFLTHMRGGRIGAAVTCRNPDRSTLSSKEAPRVTVQVLFPVGTAQLDQHLLMLFVRRSIVPPTTFLSNLGLAADDGALILETTGAGCVHHFWPLCSQLLALSPTKLLVVSTATSETWTAKMDEVMTADLTMAAHRLKWKPSRNGGRTVAAPSATQASLAATRRNRGQPNLAALSTRTVEVQALGELGREDADVLRQLMLHTLTTAGLTLSETPADRAPKAGEFYHPASRDAAAPPGRVRALLRSEAEVRLLHTTLHGQAIKVGQDLIGIQVQNDMINSEALAKNIHRRRR